jgi:hypothetical protein
LKKTFLVNDLVWITVALLVCVGGLRLGFGSFRQPQAGFMPILAGLLLGLLALADLTVGWATGWKGDREDRQVWADIDWRKILFTMAVLFAYVALSSYLGFLVGATLLLIVLFRMMERRPWWVVLLASVSTVGVFYLVFQIGLQGQLPRGLLGF